MTYCVGLKLNQGLVFMSDTLTNAGIDNVNTNKKMFFWSNKNERSVVLLTSGNLAKLPEVNKTTLLSFLFDQKNIFLFVFTLSIPAFVKVSDINTKP